MMHEDEDRNSFFTGLPEDEQGNIILSDVDSENAKDNEINSSSGLFAADHDDRVKTLYSKIDIVELLERAIDEGASDLSIGIDDYPALTIRGDIVKLTDQPMLDAQDLDILRQEVINNISERNFQRSLDLDIAYELQEGEHTGRRFRLNVAMGLGASALTFRVISNTIMKPKELGVDERVIKWFNTPRGLVMVNGPTGVGKALHKDTPIPTPGGYTPIGEIETGDLVTGLDGNYKKVTLKHNTKDKRFFELTFGNGEKVRAAGGHIWKVRVNEVPFFGGVPWGTPALCEGELKRVTSTMIFKQDKTSEEILNNIIENSSHTDLVLKTIENTDTAEEALTELLFSTVESSNSHHVKENEFIVTTYQLVEAINDGFEVYIPQLCDGDAERTIPGSPSFKFSTVDTTYRLSPPPPLDRSIGVRGEKPRELKDETLSLSNEMRGNSFPNKPYESGPVRPNNKYSKVLSCKEILGKSKDYVCITVDSDDSMFIFGRDGLATHNSTTLASILQQVILKNGLKMVTLENPVEFIYDKSGKGFVIQREVGSDTLSFTNGIDSALRQNPDIILVGEVRNEKEVDAMLNAAESGHLTVTTMHTRSASATLNRIQSIFTGEERMRILAILADSAKGFVNQTLVKSPDGKRRTAVFEVLDIDEEVSEFLRAGDVKGLEAYQIENGNTLEHGLVAAWQNGLCTYNEAYRQSANGELFEKLTEGMNKDEVVSRDDEDNFGLDFAEEDKAKEERSILVDQGEQDSGSYFAQDDDSQADDSSNGVEDGNNDVSGSDRDDIKSATEGEEDSEKSDGDSGDSSDNDQEDDNEFSIDVNADEILQDSEEPVKDIESSNDVKSYEDLILEDDTSPQGKSKDVKGEDSDNDLDLSAYEELSASGAPATSWEKPPRKKSTNVDDDPNDESEDEELIMKGSDDNKEKGKTVDEFLDGLL